MNAKLNQFIADLAGCFAATLARKNIPEADIEKMAEDLIEGLLKNWGGQLVYVCKNSNGIILKRDMEMYEKFNGTNHDALAREYNLSVPQVYRRLKSIAAALQAERQPTLF
jgi:Mor family transcriptional regulator